MAQQVRKKSWQVPSYGAGKMEVQTWQKEQIEDGLRYFESSPSYQQLQESIRILSGQPTDKLAQKQEQIGYSTLHTNRIKRNCREMVTSLSDIRFTPGYHSDANEYQGVATTMNRVAASWYADRFIDVKIKKSIQWMAITPSTYMELMYRVLPGERNRVEIDLVPHSCFDVIQTGVSESGELQESYTVTIIRNLPVYLAHSIWPDDTEKLIPDQESPVGWREKAIAVVTDVFSSGTEKRTARNPTVRLYYTYVLDLSVNKSGSTKKMGYAKDGSETPWSYDVPSVGQMIPAGYDAGGTPIFRAAKNEDCRLFPGRRLLVSTETECIYDGPMWDMHGKVPLVKMSSDSWPFADFSMIHDGANMQDAIGEMERMIHQTARNKMTPSISYNMRAIGQPKAKAIRTEVTGQRIGYNGNEGTDPIKPLLPDSFYNVEGWQPEFVKYLNEGLDYQMGVNQFSAMAKAKIGGAGDAMEKLLELAGPIVKGISRDMERAFRDIADMFLFLVLQYYTTPKIMTIVGVDGVTPETFDFDPGKIVPSHLPGEHPEKPSIHSYRERAKWIAEHIRFFITPNTLHEITQSAQKMMYLQLWRGGFPIDPWTLAEVFNIGNFGKKPEGTDDIMSRYLAWQKMQMELKAQMMQMEQELQGAAGDGGDGPSNAPGLGPKGGPKGTGGNAPSGQTSPHITPGNAERGQRVRESK